MGLFDKVMKDVAKGIQDKVAKTVEDEAKEAAEKAADAAVDKAKEAAVDKAAEEVADKASEKASGIFGDLKSAVDDMNVSLKEADAAMKEADAAMKDVTPEQWEQATAYLDKMATDSMKNMYVCVMCEEPVKGKKEFCPKCGAAMPDKSIMELALCPGCGKQNMPGTEKCEDCGAKLPYKELMEEAQSRKDAQVLDRASKELPMFPLWNCGGSHFDLCDCGDGRYIFSSWFDGNESEAQASVSRYRELARMAGFREAGKYPGEDHLYKMIDGVCYHVDTEHCFEGDSDAPSIYFLLNDEPTGGFDYVKPEPAKKSGGLFGMFK